MSKQKTKPAAPFMVRQGDVLVVRANAMPDIAPLDSASDSRGLVLAEGEQTGHAHTISWDAIARGGSDGASLYFEVSKVAALTHQEHAPITLEPGTYKVLHQREFRRAEIRRVAD